jgi:hypothetical protein
VARPKSAEGASDLTPVESTCQHLDTVAQYHGKPVAETLCETGLVHVDRLHGVPPSLGRHPDDRVGLGAQRARGAGQKQQIAQCGTVLVVRPGTTIAILLLIALLLVAGVVFVIRLSSVT